MKNKLHIFLLLGLVILQSCAEGFVLIEKSESFNNNKAKIKGAKIVYLEPSVNAYRIRKEAKQDYDLALKKEKDLLSFLPKAAHKKGFNAEFVDKSKHAELYINVLQQLEKDIYTSILVQDHPLNRGRARDRSSELRKQVFVYTPTISPEYSSLTNEFNTSLYGVSGVFSVDAKPKSRQANEFIRSHENIDIGRYYYFYNVIVDVNRAEIIYREIKQINEPLKSAFLRVVLYDSFSMLKSNTKK